MIHAHIGVDDLNFTTYNKYILTLISEVVSMRDESLNRFVSSMIDESLQEDVFVGYIEHFSKYLSYTNPDYQYNGTYLNQYVQKYISLSKMLKEKNSVYQAIAEEFKKVSDSFDLYIDTVFHCAYDKSNRIQEEEYLRIDSSRITDSSLTVRAESEHPFVFVKKYSNYSNTDIPKIVCEDFEKFIKG